MSKSKRNQVLVPIRRHLGYFRDQKTEIIYFRSDKVEHKMLNEGRGIKWSCETKLIGEARKYTEDRLVEMGAVGHTSEEKKNLSKTNPSLQSVWDELIATRHTSSQKTKDGYAKEWKIGIKPFWGDKHVIDVNPKNVIEFEQWYKTNLKHRTAFNTLKYLRMLFRYLHKESYIKRVPEINNLDAETARETKKKAPGRVYTEKEIAALLKACDDLDLPKVKLAIMFGLCMGLRKSEFINIKWADVDTKQKTVDVWRKSKQWKTLAVPKGLFKMICDQDPGTCLFPSITDSEIPMPTQHLDKGWRQVKVKAKIKHATEKGRARLHDMRHTFATHTARDNWNAKIACEYLDMSMQMYDKIYCHVSPSMMVKLVNESFGDIS